MHVSVEIVAIGTEYLQLAQIIWVSVAVVALSSDYVYFSWNRCNWLRLCVFQMKYILLPQTMYVSIEVIAIAFHLK